MLLYDSKGSPHPCLSIAKTLDWVMLQVDYDCFSDIRTRRIDPFYKELCLIISEVLVLNPEAAIKINGAAMTTGLVQEVYGQIRHDHVRLVFDNFQDVSCRVYNKKSYLRTALYNAVFEIESHSINDAFCL